MKALALALALTLSAVADGPGYIFSAEVTGLSEVETARPRVVTRAHQEAMIQVADGRGGTWTNGYLLKLTPGEMHERTLEVLCELEIRQQGEVSKATFNSNLTKGEPFRFQFGPENGANYSLRLSFLPQVEENPPQNPR